MNAWKLVISAKLTHNGEPWLWHTEEREAEEKCGYLINLYHLVCNLCHYFPHKQTDEKREL